MELLPLSHIEPGTEGWYTHGHVVAADMRLFIETVQPYRQDGATKFDGPPKHEWISTPRGMMVPITVQRLVSLGHMPRDITGQILTPEQYREWMNQRAGKELVTYTFDFSTGDMPTRQLADEEPFMSTEMGDVTHVGITSKKIGGRPRKLKARWSVTAADDLAKEMATNIRDELDKEILQKIRLGLFDPGMPPPINPKRILS